MTAKKETGPKWCQTIIVLREDILAQVQASGLDISDLCNQALAGATGIPYSARKPATLAPAAPVIIAHNGGSAKGNTLSPGVPAAEIHPVINADDPRAASAVKQVPRAPSQKMPAALPGHVPDREKRPSGTSTTEKGSPGPKPGKTEKQRERKGRESPVKRFVADAIIREEDEGGHVTKDNLYQAFSQWCREHRVTPVPDRKALTTALKTRFALIEKSVDGEPSWINIRLK
jgi:hypothetical protein